MPLTAEPQVSLKDEASFFLRKYVEQMLRFRSWCTGLENFEPRSDDIFIATAGKSGTTLLQQLVYQLKVVSGNVATDPNGDNFEDISMVVPFIEASPLNGIRESVNPYSPRAWKTHATPDGTAYDSKIDPKIGSTICCVRNPLHIAPSFLDFTLDWVLDGQVQGEELREELYYQYLMRVWLSCERMPDGSFKRNDERFGRWFTHVKSWLQVQGDNILYLVYEDIIQDIPGTVRLVANFLSIRVTPEQVATVVARCERDFMTKNPRFRDVLVAKGMGWSLDGGMRARVKDVPGFKNVKLRDDCRAIHDQMLYEAFGAREYSEVAELVRQREKRRQCGGS